MAYRVEGFLGAVLGLAVVSAVVGGAVFAQTEGTEFAGIEEVVVTAQKREESLQDIPIAVSALGAEEIKNLGISDARDLGNALPSLQTPAFPTSSNNLGFFIRGIGNADSNILTRDNSVGLYVDGVYLGRTTGMLADLVDIGRIEVLRGPQGTLYGRNTTGGAINFVSAPPSGEFSIKEEIDLGNFNYLKSRTIVNFPAQGGLRAKLAYVTADRDGWVENKGGNALAGGEYEDYYQNTQSGVRLRALWDFAEGLFADYAYDYSDMETTPPYYQYNGGVVPSAVPNTFPKRLEDATSPLTGADYAFYLPLNDTLSEGHSLTLNWDINENWNFKAITGARRFDSDQEQNFANSFAFAFPFATDIRIENEQFSQEFQFIGDLGGVRYVSGFYYLKESGSYEENQFVEREQFVLRNIIQYSDLRTSTPTPIDTDPAPANEVFLANDSGTFRVDSELESWALFGQAAWWVRDRLELTLGLRYTEDERDDERITVAESPDPGTTLNDVTLPFQFPPGTAKGSFEKLDYSIALDYAVDDAMRVYGRFATGFRSGGSSPRSSPNFEIGQHGEEELVSYEVGLKSYFFDNRVRLNGAVFRSEYDDIILDFLPQVANPNLVVGVNAGEGEIDGFEVELLLAPSARLRLGLNYTYLNAEINDVITPPDPLTAVDNFELLWAPQHAYSLSFDYQFEPFEFGQLDVHLDYAWQDDQIANASTANGKIVVGDFGQLNGRATLANIRAGNTLLSVALWGKNLSDSDEINYNIANSAFTYQEPRRYGLDLSLQF